PIANLISLPLQNNTNFNAGPEERTQNILNVQPVWPFSISENWNLITRTIIPVTWVSSGAQIGDGVIPSPIGNDHIFGLGDSTVTAFFSPKDSGKLTWGVGPVALIPTSTDDALGAGEWGGGLSAVFLGMPGNWVVGSLFSNVWTPEEDDGSRAVNLFTWQYFINYNIPDANGLYLTTAPIINANWEADSNNRWTVPFGGGVGKIFKIGEQPVNGQISAYYNVEKPEFGADWQLRLQLQFLFPK
ncbi:MAG TPA: neuromedin U, partial [Gammaproteobacteria bacterium]|nr:neuromedin U [Gammaproteobacteria bacterium]